MVIIFCFSPLQNKLDLSASPTRTDDVNPRVEQLVAVFKVNNNHMTVRNQILSPCLDHAAYDRITEVSKNVPKARKLLANQWLWKTKETLQDMAPQEQLDVFTRMIEESSMNNIRHLRSVIEPHFQRDFLSCLPVEVHLSDQVFPIFCISARHENSREPHWKWLDEGGRGVEKLEIHVRVRHSLEITWRRDCRRTSWSEVDFVFIY